MKKKMGMGLAAVMAAAQLLWCGAAAQGEVAKVDYDGGTHTGAVSYQAMTVDCYLTGDAQTAKLSLDTVELLDACGSPVPLLGVSYDPDKKCVSVLPSQLLQGTDYTLLLDSALFDGAGEAVEAAFSTSYDTLRLQAEISGAAASRSVSVSAQGTAGGRFTVISMQYRQGTLVDAKSVSGAAPYTGSIAMDGLQSGDTVKVIGIVDGGENDMRPLAQTQIP